MLYCRTPVVVTIPIDWLSFLRAWSNYKRSLNAILAADWNDFTTGNIVFKAHKVVPATKENREDHEITETEKRVFTESFKNIARQIKVESSGIQSVKPY